MNKLYTIFFKRLFDIFFSLLGLLVLILVFVPIGLIIYMEDKGPVFYNAKRIGKNGKIFKMYKFRTMKVNAPDLRNEDGSTYNSDDDPRLTKIGKFLRKTSIDELPQLLNVLKGDMSLVGPRPYIVDSYKGYESLDKINQKRMLVRPGITGYSQAYFRNSIPSDAKLKNDIYYVDNISLKLDIKILFHTFKSVIKSENIYNSNQNKSK